MNYARVSGALSSGGFEADVKKRSSNSTTGGGAGGGDRASLGIIKRRISRRGAIEVDGRTNTLIITDVRENIDSIKQLVTVLDQPEPQVEIETRIVIAPTQFPPRHRRSTRFSVWRILSAAADSAQATARKTIRQHSDRTILLNDRHLAAQRAVAGRRLI